MVGPCISEEVTMRIAVFGAGGIGGYLGARLAQAGDEVVLIARGAHLTAIREHGLFVDSPTGDFHMTPSIATDRPADVGVVDAVLLGVKAWDVRAAAEAIRPMIGATTGVLTLQNGVEAPIEVAKVVGKDHVIVGAANVRCLIAGPGRLRHVGGVDPNLTMGEIDNRSSTRVERIRTALEKVRVTVNVPENIQAWLWGKFVWMAAVGGVGAVVRVPIGVWRQIPQVRTMVERAAQEVVAVAQARGVQPPEGIIDQLKGIIDAFSPGHMSSMHEELVGGRPSELEYWNGAVVRLGQEAGVATPLNAFIYHSLLPQERQARGQV
jgi:2-dehydropantoate 2-reductase